MGRGTRIFFSLSRWSRSRWWERGGREVGESWERGGRVVGDVIVNMCTVPATTAICFVHVKALGRLIILLFYHAYLALLRPSMIGPRKMSLRIK